MAVIANSVSRVSGVLRLAVRLGAGVVGLGVTGYAVYAGVTWRRYAYPPPG